MADEILLRLNLVCSGLATSTAAPTSATPCHCQSLVDVDCKDLEDYVIDPDGHHGLDPMPDGDEMDLALVADSSLEGHPWYQC